MKVIITGATGMVGEGVLFECLDDILQVAMQKQNWKKQLYKALSSHCLVHKGNGVSQASLACIIAKQVLL